MLRICSRSWCTSPKILRRCNGNRADRRSVEERSACCAAAAAIALGSTDQRSLQSDRPERIARGVFRSGRQQRHCECTADSWRRHLQADVHGPAIAAASGNSVSASCVCFTSRRLQAPYIGPCVMSVYIITVPTPATSCWSCCRGAVTLTSGTSMAAHPCTVLVVLRLQGCSYGETHACA